MSGIDRDTFRKIFGIDHARLIEGGEELVALKGLVGESLFAAGLGGSGLATALSDLEAEAQELLAKNKPSSKIRAARKDYDQAIAEKRQATVPFAKLKKLEKERQAVAAEKQAVMDQLRAVRVEMNRLERIRRSLSLLSQRRRWQSQLASLGDVHVLPTEYSAEERSRIQGQLAELKPRLQAMQERLDGAGGLRQQLASIVVRRHVLAQQSSIRDLQEQLGAYQQESQDEKTLTARRAEVRSQIERLLRDLSLTESNSADDWDQLEKLRVTPECRVAIQTLSSDDKPSQQKPSELQTQQQDLQQELTGKREELTRWGDSPDVNQLARLCQQIRQRGDLEGELQKCKAKLNVVTQAAEQELGRLPLWSGSSEQLLATAFPLPETIESFEQVLLANEHADLQSQAEINQWSTELLAVEEELVALQKSGQTPTEEDLLAAREQRDQLWHSIRLDWLTGAVAGDGLSAETGSAETGSAETGSAEMGSAEMGSGEMGSGEMGSGADGALPDLPADGGPAPTSLASQAGQLQDWASQFEAAVAAADEVGDRLRREAERVQKQARLLARQQHLQRSIAAARETGETLAAQRSQLIRDWKQLWVACTINAPRSPREMRSWLAQVSTLTRSLGAVSESQTSCDELAAEIADSRRQIVRGLRAAGERAATKSTLQQLLEAAESCVKRREEQQRQGQRLRREITELEARWAKLDTRLAAAKAARQSWEEKWAVAMGQIGCPENALVAQAHERLNQLDELSKRLDEGRGIDAQLGKIRQRAIEFAAVVHDLAAQVQLTCPGQAPQVIAGQLQAELEDARQELAKHERLERELEEDTREVAAALEQERQLQSRLQQLCHMAGAPPDEELAAVEQRSRDYLQATGQLRNVEDQLLELGDGRSIEDMQREAEGQDADQLVVSIAALHQQDEELSSAREALAVRENQLAQAAELGPSAGSSGTSSAEADQRALGILSRIQRDAQQYVNLRLAAVVLRQLIDRHRAENEDPLLYRASDFFSRLTCNEFRELRTEYDLHDAATIVGVRSDNEVVPVAAMSRGTRDQLYLALRLGYLERMVTEGEALPFIVDDILIHFDDDRAAAALEVLGELSDATQVILFTHHRRIVDMVAARLDDHVRFVHQLPGRLSPSAVPT